MGCGRIKPLNRVPRKAHACFSHENFATPGKRRASRAHEHSVRGGQSGSVWLVGTEGRLLTRNVTGLAFGLGGPIGFRTAIGCPGSKRRGRSRSSVRPCDGKPGISGQNQMRRPDPGQNMKFSRSLAERLIDCGVRHSSCGAAIQRAGDFARQLLLGGQERPPRTSG